MSTSLTSEERVLMWNIHFWQHPEGTHNHVHCGAFQPPPPAVPSLTWRRLYEDLNICFDLSPYQSSVASIGSAADSVRKFDLVIWYRGKRPDANPFIVSSEDQLGTIARRPLPYVTIHRNWSVEEFQTLGVEIPLESPITVQQPDHDTNDLDSDEDPILPVTLAAHDISCKALSSPSLPDHVRAGCARVVRLLRNPNIKYYPIPSGGGGYGGTGNSAAASVGDTTASSASSKRRKCDDETGLQLTESPVSKLPQFTQLPGEVRQAYKGTCAITATTTSYKRKTMLCGPGMKAAHILPRSLYWAYPGADPDSDDLWSLANSPSNMLLLTATTHDIHDQRIVAIDPKTDRVRLFAAIPYLVPRNEKQAVFPYPTHPNPDCLGWHYEMCVIENMAAKVLQTDGSRLKQKLRRPTRSNTASLPVSGRARPSAHSQHPIASAPVPEPEQAPRSTQTENLTAHELTSHHVLPSEVPDGASRATPPLLTFCASPSSPESPTSVQEEGLDDPLIPEDMDYIDSELRPVVALQKEVSDAMAWIRSSAASE